MSGKNIREEFLNASIQQCEEFIEALTFLHATNRSDVDDKTYNDIKNMALDHIYWCEEKYSELTCGR